MISNAGPWSISAILILTSLSDVSSTTIVLLVATVLLLVCKTSVESAPGRRALNSSKLMPFLVGKSYGTYEMLSVAWIDSKPSENINLTIW